MNINHVNAKTIIANGNAGGVKWTLYDDNVMEIEPLIDGTATKKIGYMDSALFLASYTNSIKDNTYELVVKDGVLNIAKASFKDSWFLNKVTLASSVKTIESNAFENVPCYNFNLKYVEVIESGAFKCCGVAEHVNLSNAKFIGNGAFDRSSMKTIQFSSKIEKIDKYAFSGCSMLEEVNISAESLYIGDYAFESSDYSNMTFVSIDVNDSLYLGNGVFYNNPNLNKVSLPDGSLITYVGDNILSNTKYEDEQRKDGILVCGDVLVNADDEYVLDGQYSRPYTYHNLKIDKGIKVIASNSFDNANVTGTLTITDGVEVVGDNAFKSLRGLYKEYDALYLSDTLEIIGDYAFYAEYGQDTKIKGEYKFANTLKEIGSYAFANQEIEKVVFSDNVSKIEEWAFGGNQYLDYIVLGSGIKEIGKGAFNNCGSAVLDENEASVSIPSGLDFDYIDGELFADGILKNELYHTLSIDGCKGEDDYAHNCYIYWHNAMLKNHEDYNGFDETFNYVSVAQGTEVIGARTLPGDYVETLTVDIPASVKTIGEWYRSKNTKLVINYAGSKSQWDQIRFADCNINGDAYEYKDYDWIQLDECNQEGSNIILNYGVKESFDDLKVAKLTEKNYTVSGNNVTPYVELIDQNGTELVLGTDYRITYNEENRSKVGRYSMKVVLCAPAYKGSKTFYFNVYPERPKSMSADLYGDYKAVKVTWSKVDDADGYFVYYKKASEEKYTSLGRTLNNYKVKKDLDAGTQYVFKVIPYFETTSGTRYKALSGPSKAIYTLKKPTVNISKKTSGKVTVKWTNMSGESGYQISKSATKGKTKIVSTYTTTTGKYKYISATKGKTYYYKVRAFKTVNGKKVYGPWSAEKAYKLQ